MALNDVTRDLLDVQQIDEKFQSERIEANPHQFDDRPPKLKLKTFSHLKHQVKSVYKYKESVVYHGLYSAVMLL